MRCLVVVDDARVRDVIVRLLSGDGLARHPVVSGAEVLALVAAFAASFPDVAKLPIPTPDVPVPRLSIPALV